MTLPSILVIGATGTVGSRLVRQLAAAGVKPRVLVRSRDKADAISSLATPVIGDLKAPDSLATAFRGAAFAGSKSRPQDLRGRWGRAPRSPNRQRRAGRLCAAHGRLLREGQSGLLQAHGHRLAAARPRAASLRRLAPRVPSRRGGRGVIPTPSAAAAATTLSPTKRTFM